MRVFDPLYGPFTVPPYLAQLLLTPEVRRLSQVRLLNALSPSLAALGEVRRYSHTLGVLYLCQKVQTLGYSIEERKALAASVLLHDIGTPPFAHLFEYHLRDRTGWSHEGMIKSVLWGFHAPENRAHQIFAGQTIEFRQALKKVDIAVDLVAQIVSEAHPLSKFLFGSLDLDNLDNVARMGWALGIDRGSACALQLASLLFVGRDSLVQLPIRQGAEAVNQWASLRAAVYEILVFDPPTVAAQAVLSEAIGLAIREGLLTADDWTMTDEQLLDTLREHRITKDLVAREYLGRLPAMAFCIQLDGTLESIGLGDRESPKRQIEDVLRLAFPGATVLGYVFVDKGAFSKRLQFVDPSTGEKWSSHHTSSSIVLYGFVRAANSLRVEQCQDAVNALIGSAPYSGSRIRRTIIAPTDHDDAQTSLNISS